ncbi:FAD:protein FMN transferase [Niallia sp.]|uniref:FAD:protein FMN transferase n=1 Tax=Niallia sp. TaxID=2837523 RepID=UPI002898C1D3|nr:FAD:protein FMN transferase [Niallia sp.]
MNAEIPLNYTFFFEAIGCNWEVVTIEPLEKTLEWKILERIEQFEKVYSRFRVDSLISKVANASFGGIFEFPEDSLELFNLYDQLHRLTLGAIDPLIGLDLELLGYDRKYSLQPASDKVRAKAHILGRPNWSKDVIRKKQSLVTKRPFVIDIGAVGKGYLVDIISSMLLQVGHNDFVIDGSGDILHLGHTGTMIGLEHPFNPEIVIGVVNIKNKSLCASAVNRRSWGNGYHHVFDGRTGIPVKDIVATWVIADTTAIADGLATALFFVSGDILTKDFDFSFVRMFSDGCVEISKNFEGDIFT